MKKIFLLLLLFTCFYAKGQLINKAEYFIDTDPGNGNGIDIPVATPGVNVNLSFNVPTTGLAEGFHNLFSRTRTDDGIWSLSEKRTLWISVLETATNDIVAAEYFIDTDPGNGNGIALNVSTTGATVSFAGVVPTTGLTGGFHNLSIRTKNTAGVWSLSETRAFFISILDGTANDIVAAEYFIDADPGQGNAVAINVGTVGASVSFASVIPTTSLTEGFHNLYIRTKNVLGVWGMFESRTFFISNQGLPAADITAMEYYIDNDPGFGNGVAVNITTGSTVTLLANVATAGLTAGKHFLFMRAKSANGWGLAEQKEFTVGAAVAPAKPLIASIDAKTTSPVLTNINRPVIRGTAEPNVTIELFSGTPSLGTVTADASGNWNFTPGADIPDGTYSITAKAKNASNLESVASDVFVVTIDTQAPSTPILVSVDGRTTANFTTNNNRPVIIGTAEANSTIEVFNGTTSLGFATVNASGNFTFTPPTDLQNGNYSLTLRTKDTAGNLSNASVAFNFAVNNVSFAAPVIVSIGGKSPSPVVIAAINTTIVGTAAANAQLELFENDVARGTLTADASGNWTLNFVINDKTNGSVHLIKARQKDNFGNLGPFSNVFQFTVDSQPPTTPIILSIDGKNTPPVITSNRKPVIIGKTDPNTFVILRFNEPAPFAPTVFSTTTSNANGDFTIDATRYGVNGLVDRNYVITAIARDEVSNFSVASNDFNLIIDNFAPNAPILASVDGKASQNFATTTAKPIIIGTAEPGSTIEIFNGTTSLGTVTVDGNGNYTFTPPANLPDGNYMLTTKAKDAAGNVSVSSNSFTFILDATAPNAPVISSVDAKTVQNFSTSNKRPVIVGTVENLSSVELFNGNLSFGVLNATTAGGFTFTPSTPLADGNYILTARAKDAVGNISVASASFSFNIDTSSPTAPVIVSIDGKTTANFLTANNKPPFNGNAESLSTVELFNGSTSIGTVSATSTGSFGFTPSSALPDGNYIVTARARDAAGNLSATSNVFNFTIDAKAPSTPLIVSIDGKVNSPAVSTNLQPAFVGTAEPLSTVTIFQGNVVLTTVTTNATGNWTFSPTTGFGIGVYNFSVTAKDATGNESAKSNVFVYDLVPVDKTVSANNVLTPNGDGKNDFLVVENLQYYPKNLIRIYDRGGRTVYTANAYKNDWGGDLNGTALAEGTYYYVIELGDSFKAFKSFITVVRKSIR